MSFHVVPAALDDNPRQIVQIEYVRVRLPVAGRTHWHPRCLSLRLEHVVPHDDNCSPIQSAGQFDLPDGQLSEDSLLFISAALDGGEPAGVTLSMALEPS
jgi:hypothetical protein